MQSSVDLHRDRMTRVWLRKQMTLHDLGSLSAKSNPKSEYRNPKQIQNANIQNNNPSPVIASDRRERGNLNFLGVMRLLLRYAPWPTRVLARAGLAVTCKKSFNVLQHAVGKFIYHF